jgi:hypothetical protein
MGETSFAIRMVFPVMNRKKLRVKELIRQLYESRNIALKYQPRLKTHMLLFLTVRAASNSHPFHLSACL